MRNRILTVVLLLALAVALVGCSGSGTGGGGSTPPASGGGTSAGSTTVVEDGFAFDPAQLEVKVGDTVTFENKDSATHNVSIDGKSLGPQATGDKVTWKAEKAGTFPYSCSIHPAMTGTIVVK